MNFAFSEDQRALLDAVEKLAARHAAAPLPPVRWQHSAALEADLEQAGFFDAIAIDELGPVAAAATVTALARLPSCAELSASALLAPWLCPDLPRPFAVLWEDGQSPTRFLPVARTAIRVRSAAVEVSPLQDGDVETVSSTFAYPMGRLRRAHWQPLAGADAQRVLTSWRVGIACEIAGNLSAAITSVIDHVSQRRQFGRPLGSFQAVQHRLAECATLVEGAKWLALRAAASANAADAAMACGQAQSLTRKVAYDLHQFMGAMGLTLEHPLHRWTYRAKLLQADLQGADLQFAAAARLAWPAQGATA